MSSYDIAMKEHGQIKQVSAFSLIVACALCFTLVTTITKQVPRYTRYRGVFFTVNTVDEILSTAHRSLLEDLKIRNCLHASY